MVFDFGGKRQGSKNKNQKPFHLYSFGREAEGCWLEGIGLCIRYRAKRRIWREDVSLSWSRSQRGGAWLVDFDGFSTVCIQDAFHFFGFLKMSKFKLSSRNASRGFFFGL